MAEIYIACATNNRSPYAMDIFTTESKALQFIEDMASEDVEAMSAAGIIDWDYDEDDEDDDTPRTRHSVSRQQAEAAAYESRLENAYDIVYCDPTDAHQAEEAIALVLATHFDPDNGIYAGDVGNMIEYLLAQGADPHTLLTNRSRLTEASRILDALDLCIGEHRTLELIGAMDETLLDPDATRAIERRLKRARGERMFGL